MIGVGLGLLALALGDLVSGGLAGQPESRARALAGAGAGLACVALGAWLVDLDHALWFLLLVAAGGAGWQLFRASPDHGSRAAGWALAVIGTWFASLVAASAAWTASVPAQLSHWLAGLAFRTGTPLAVDHFFLVAGIVVALTATANGVVRAVLAVAGSAVARSEERLRGGRFIGVVERLLTFGLAVAGEPAAAALIASAKSILRFPELTRVAGEKGSTETPRDGKLVADVDVVTEYFLLGSLASWLLALAPVALLRG